MGYIPENCGCPLCNPEGDHRLTDFLSDIYRRMRVQEQNNLRDKKTD